jgi:hypothetical protein
MSKILVVQPHRILRHAFAVALAEHQVEAVEIIPEAKALKAADVVIVDAGALRERGALTARELQLVKSWQVPTLWIDPDGKPPNEKFKQLTWPLGRDELKKAVAECLAKPIGKSESIAAPENRGGAPVAEKQAPRELEASEPAGADKQVIELVDVVE